MIRLVGNHKPCVTFTKASKLCTEKFSVGLETFARISSCTSAVRLGSVESFALRITDLVKNCSKIVHEAEIKINFAYHVAETCNMGGNVGNSGF